MQWNAGHLVAIKGISQVREEQAHLLVFIRLTFPRRLGCRLHFTPAETPPFFLVQVIYIIKDNPLPWASISNVRQQVRLGDR